MNRGRHKTNEFSINKQLGAIKDTWLEQLPVLALVQMQKYQIACGNMPNLRVFINNPYAVKNDGGFDWRKTSEGMWYWNDLLIHTYARMGCLR